MVLTDYKNPRLNVANVENNLKILIANVRKANHHDTEVLNTKDGKKVQTMMKLEISE